MPRRYMQRTLEVEQELAETIADHRKRLGLSYEALAERMREVGCEIHASGIQKTERSGRRITVDELIAYAAVFDATVDDLLQSKKMKAGIQFTRDLAHGLEIITTLRQLQTDLTSLEAKLADSLYDPEDGAAREQIVREALAAKEADGDATSPEATFYRNILSTLKAAAADRGRAGGKPAM